MHGDRISAVCLGRTNGRGKVEAHSAFGPSLAGSRDAVRRYPRRQDWHRCGRRTELVRALQDQFDRESHNEYERDSE